MAGNLYRSPSPVELHKRYLFAGFLHNPVVVTAEAAEDLLDFGEGFVTAC
ncbi:hypothetical protein [Pseudomonas sp. S9]|nr:hypothetical protein [Pseudomonas sp. S9]